MSATVIGVSGAIEQSAKFASKLMDKLPDYPQKKKEKFYKLNQEYLNAKKKNYPERDDNLILDLRDKLFQFNEIFLTEISS